MVVRDDVGDADLGRFGGKESLGEDVRSAKGPLDHPAAAATKFSAVGGRFALGTPDRKRDNHLDMESSDVKQTLFCFRGAVASDVRGNSLLNYVHTIIDNATIWSIHNHNPAASRLNPQLL